MSREGKVVCVTGASGYIASWLVKLLLQRGYTVKATVRDPNDPKKVEHLCMLDGAKERLQLFRANLVEEGSFDAAVEGCEGVFHTASPATLDVEDPQAELLDPAVKGTLNVLRSCAKVPSIKRVILTSSMAAVVHNTRPLGPEVVVDESWYSDPDFCRETKQWYTLSKTLAEDAAWKYVKDMKFDMVTINPAVVLGPLLQPTLNGSSDEMIVKLFNGSETYPNLTLSWVHVKDVANAHILALEDPSANGRYCLAGFVANFSEIIKILNELYPDVILPKKCVGDDPYAPHQLSQEKTRSLGIDYIPLKTCLKDTVDSLKEKGFISI